MTHTKRPRAGEEFGRLRDELVDLCLAFVPHGDWDVHDVADITEGGQRTVQEQREEVTLLVLV